MTSTVISIKGMHCRACEELLTEVLQEAPGVESATVSLKDAAARVHYDTAKTTEAALRKAIEAEGYKTA